MKRIVRITLKVILAIVFLQNIGLFSLISSMPTDKPVPQKLNRGKEDNQYLNEKIRNAKNLGDNYGPEEYFNDLKDIKLRAKDNHFDAQVDLNYTSVINTLYSGPLCQDSFGAIKKLDWPRRYLS